MINEAISVISETFRERQQGKLIAKLIATTRSHTSNDLRSERSGSIRKLAGHENIMNNSLSIFIARMDEDPFAEQKSSVRTLLNNRMKGGV